MMEHCKIIDSWVYLRMLGFGVVHVQFHGWKALHLMLRRAFTIQTRTYSCRLCDCCHVSDAMKLIVLAKSVGRCDLAHRDLAHRKWPRTWLPLSVMSLR